MFTYEQIGESAGQECKAALQETNKLLELGLKVNAKAVKALFNATEVSSLSLCLELMIMEVEVPLQSNKSFEICSLVLMLISYT